MGDKRLREWMGDELSRSPRDHHNREDLSESEESKHEQWSLSTRIKQDTLVGPTVYVALTDASVLQLLMAIETSTLTIVELSLDLQEVFKMLTQDVIVKYLDGGQRPKLSIVVCEVLTRADQLTVDELTGLLVASLILGNACWISSVKMLGSIHALERTKLFGQFRWHIMKLYSTEASEWILENWKVADQHTQLIKHLEKTTPASVKLILNLSTTYLGL